MENFPCGGELRSDHITGHTFGNAADDLIPDRSVQGCQFVGGNGFFAVRAEHGDNVPRLDFLRHVGHVQHQLIHADPSHDGTASAVEQCVCLIGQQPCIAVSVANGHCGNGAGLVGSVGSAVADAGAGIHMLHVGNHASQGHDRL